MFSTLTLADYSALNQKLAEQNKEDRHKLSRHLAQTDLFFLLTVVLGRKDVFRQWLLDRCIEVNNNPDGYLDLWARDHYKSTIITFGLTIKDILNDPEDTFGIFSHSAKIAKDFLLQIKREFEDNKLLYSLFPDILYENPNKDAPAWNSERIIVKRKSNPKEATIEAHGVVENQPTGKHFKKRVYDDVVTRDSVYTSDMIKKTNGAWELSLNLGMKGGVSRYIGTRYHFKDTYKLIMDREAAIPRIYTATYEGTADGEPVLLSKKELEDKRRTMGSYTFSCQMLQNPVADDNAAFHRKNLEFYQVRNERLIEFARQCNVYIMVDGASVKSKDSDYTIMVVVGCNMDGNYYLIDIVRDKLNLSQRSETLFRLVKKWKPKKVGYEKNSREADIEYIKMQMDELHYRFSITEVHTKMNKQDKIISTLQPIFEAHKFYLPLELLYVNWEGKKVDLIHDFIEEEYVFYPFSIHDDMLDCMSMMIRNISHTFPLAKEDQDYNFYKHREIQQEQQYHPITGEAL